MSDKRRIRARTACEIADIGPDRFNEAVAAGHYPCAPKTRPGAARLFDIDDLTALCIYGQRLKNGYSPIQAGEVACLVLQKMKEDPKEARIGIINFANTHRFEISDSAAFLHSEVDWDAPDVPGFGRIFDFTIFRIDTIRERVIQKVDEAQMIVGED